MYDREYILESVKGLENTKDNAEGNNGVEIDWGVSASEDNEIDWGVAEGNNAEIDWGISTPKENAIDWGVSENNAEIDWNTSTSENSTIDWDSANENTETWNISIEEENNDQKMELIHKFDNVDYRLSCMNSLQEVNGILLYLP